MYTPVNPQFYYIKVECKGVYITQTCFLDASQISVQSFWLDPYAMSEFKNTIKCTS